MRLRVLVFPVEDTAAINQTVDRRRAAKRVPAVFSPSALPSRLLPRQRGSTTAINSLFFSFFAMCNDLKAPMVYEAIR